MESNTTTVSAESGVRTSAVYGRPTNPAELLGHVRTLRDALADVPKGVVKSIADIILSEDAEKYPDRESRAAALETLIENTRALAGFALAGFDPVGSDDERRRILSVNTDRVKVPDGTGALRNGNLRTITRHLIGSDDKNVKRAVSSL